MQSRPKKRKRAREGFNKYEDPSYEKLEIARGADPDHNDANWDHGYKLAALDKYDPPPNSVGFNHSNRAMADNVGYYYNSVNRTSATNSALAGGLAGAGEA